MQWCSAPPVWSSVNRWKGNVKVSKYRYKFIILTRLRVKYFSTNRRAALTVWNHFPISFIMHVWFIHLSLTPFIYYFLVFIISQRMCVNCRRLFSLDQTLCSRTDMNLRRLRCWQGERWSSNSSTLSLLELLRLCKITAGAPGPERKQKKLVIAI